ncbi:peroxide stress protein YaaA [Candidatus Poribacteria bacterium]|nr:peroxide stress protein YaaA [Candidatus Poribacteria bacterium]
MTKHKYLLIIPCSKRKVLVLEHKIPAIDLYDGPFYRILRKFFRQHDVAQYVDILILSTKYGLIKSHDLISTYDECMTPRKAKGFSSDIYNFLKTLLSKEQYQEIFINLGKTYALALTDSEELLNQYNVFWAKGQIGERMHQLKNWLQKVIDKERLEGQ